MALAVAITLAPTQTIFSMERFWTALGLTCHEAAAAD